MAEKRKLFLHIGMYKTGSTSIQYFLNANTDRLYDNGFLYPTSGRHPRAFVSHQLLSEVFSTAARSSGDFGLAFVPDRQIVLSALKQEINLSDKPNVILSAEAFCLFSPDEVREFCNEFADFDIVPIVVLRNYADLADASYQTVVMTNAASKTFDQMGFNHWTTFQNVFEMCKVWDSMAGGGKIIVRNFDSSKASDMVVTFADAIKLPMKRLARNASEARTNQSVRPALVVVRRSMIEGGARPQDADALVSQLSKLNFGEGQTHVPPELRDELNSVYLTHIKQLLESKMASADDFDLPELEAKLNQERVHIKNLTHAVFALGRAVFRTIK